MNSLEILFNVFLSENCLYSIYSLLNNLRVSLRSFNARNNLNIKQIMHFHPNHFNVTQLKTDTSIGPRINFEHFWEQRKKQSRIFHFIRGRVHQTLEILFREI